MYADENKYGFGYVPSSYKMRYFLHLFPKLVKLHQVDFLHIYRPFGVIEKAAPQCGRVETNTPER